LAGCFECNAQEGEAQTFLSEGIISVRKLWLLYRQLLIFSLSDGKDQSILPANASWGTRNNYAFDDEFEDYSAGFVISLVGVFNCCCLNFSCRSSSESDPQQRRKETAVAGSSSGSGNQLEKVGSQQVINQSASTSEGRDEKKSAQPAPSAAAPSNAANNNQRKNQVLSFVPSVAIMAFIYGS